jgi:hypothetical protein|tara:strand:- start:173 stop:1711 length:1539 start_codon:yes stop_codon:yes gene_type:complete
VNPTIDVSQVVELSEIASCGCALPGGLLALGGSDNSGISTGSVSLIHSEGQCIGRQNFEGKIIAVISLEDKVFIASSTGGVSAFSLDLESLVWSVEVEAGCDLMVAAGEDIVLADGAGAVWRILPNGEVLRKNTIGEITHLCSSNDGEVVGIGLSDGRVVMMDSSENILQDSLAADDDIETISAMSFRSDNTLIVARNSLGMALDERFENRIECWNVSQGLLQTTELPAPATTILPTEFGIVVGCFNGELLEIEIGSEPTILHKFDYSITTISRWENDLLIGSWFDIARYTRKDNKIIWSLEHIGIIEQIISLDNGCVGVIGDDRKHATPAPLFIINPDSEPKTVEEIHDYDEIEFSGKVQASVEFSGSLTKEEEVAAEERPIFPDDASSILGDLSEELEIVIEETVVEVDILKDLAESARSLNIPPIADVGEDKTIQSDVDGTATIMLDGTSSYDPDGEIIGWAWEDKNGRLIGESAQIKVRLPKGVHAFHLTVSDNRGASNKATFTVQIL